MRRLQQAPFQSRGGDGHDEEDRGTEEERRSSRHEGEELEDRSGWRDRQDSVGECP